MARYESFDPETYNELKALRQDIKDVFNKGLDPGAELIDQLYFLDSKTKDYVDKLSRAYNKIVTPEDFKLIANIMSENLESSTPILKDFTKYFGRLAQDFLINSKPSQSAFDIQSILKQSLLSGYKKGVKLPTWLNNIMGIKDEALREKLLNRIPGYVPGSFTSELITGVKAPTRRRTGFKIGNYSLFSEDITKGFEVGYPNKLDKNWSNIPWVNFDGKILEQNYTQNFEEKLAYKDANGNWVNNILQIPQRTEPNWWEEFRNKPGKINDIADATRARTAFGVNGNHSNDATLVKQFHLWGKKSNIQTSTIHDAFFTNAADMLDARKALRIIYANAVEKDSIKSTLDEMLARGFPRDLYDKYLNEAIDIGLIPVAGRSRVGGKILTKEDILTKSDILATVQENFKDNRYFYGIG
jgi:hypothetical protein